MKLKRYSKWNLYFVEYSYLRSSTAQAPVLKCFKIFPVDPTVEYIRSIEFAHLRGDFNQRDVLIEIINMLVEMEDMSKEGSLGYYEEYFLDKEIRILAEKTGIKL